MNPVLYVMNGNLPANKYLLGSYKWPYDVRLTGALLDIGALPVTGTLSLVLEVGGVLLTTQYTIGAGTLPPDARQELPISVVIPANTTVRWKGLFDGDETASAAYLSLTLTVSPVAGAVVYQPKLQVDYVKALAGVTSRVTVYRYDAASHTFTEAQPGVSVGRATIATVAGVLTVAIEGVTALQVGGGVVTVASLVEGTSSPVSLGLQGTAWVEFLAATAPGGGMVRVASLTKSGSLLVPTATEAAPTSLAAPDPAFYERFELWGAALTGVLNAQPGNLGLVASALGEL